MPSHNPIQPHGSTLVDRVLSGAAAAEARAIAQSAPRVTLSEVALADLEMIASGAYSPLTGFLGHADYERVVSEMRLSNGTLWPIPITLPVSESRADMLREGQPVGLYSADGALVGLLELRERFGYDARREAEQVYRTTAAEHPGVARLYAQGPVLLAGDVWLLDLPRSSFPSLAFAPSATRAIFAERGWRTIVGFQTRNPVHRAHEYLQKAALELVDGLLLHPLVGATKDDDVPAATRVRSYEVLLEGYYPRERVLLAAYPAAMRYAGPREALLHAISRQNYGCTHFIVGRDHAGVGSYYGTYDAQRLFDTLEPGDLAITPLKFEHTFFCKTCGNIASTRTCPHTSEHHLVLSGTRVRELLRAGTLPPPEFTRPEVARVLIDAMRAV
ncbi:MAG TPA: sulfate adenylyltransferase [Kouleothrix sp.]|uniref:sulfate adenylyltransferase n=1 Tax=Kouleothrix sp. TaxID=2779161 RepID=UPI002B812537|nr:sulfate adenylyltransferase [Kouleothrix sp.]HRC75055.1 sulfate adenylyltransferase [Kouleothrix sp.]